MRQISNIIVCIIEISWNFKYLHTILNIISEVNILPFVRMKHPGTITWLWGRITVGANCVIFAEFWFSRPRKHLILSISTGTVGHMTNCTRRELYLKWFEKIESNLWWPSYPRCSWSHDQLYQAWTVLQMIWKNRIKFMMTVLS